MLWSSPDEARRLSLLGPAVVTPSVASRPGACFPTGAACPQSRNRRRQARPAYARLRASVKAPPGDEYYVEPATAGPSRHNPKQRRPNPQEPPPFEPPPPGATSFEPPPPPAIAHLAPNTALSLGVRLGWFFPFGNAWARAKPVDTAAGSGYVLEGVPWRDYASSGPVFELNAGLRLSHAYTVFGLWERAQLGSGRNNSSPDGKQDGAETDFWAVGMRASSNPDPIGFLTEVAVGYRHTRTFFTSGVEYQFANAPFEARLGLGAETRLNRMTTLSSLITIGVGGFGSVESVAPNGSSVALTKSSDQGDGHAWVAISVGVHFDVLASRH